MVNRCGCDFNCGSHKIVKKRVVRMRVAGKRGLSDMCDRPVNGQSKGSAPDMQIWGKSAFDDEPNGTVNDVNSKDEAAARWACMSQLPKIGYAWRGKVNCFMTWQKFSC